LDVAGLRARIERWGLIVSSVGPHPVELGRTFAFLVGRRLRRRRPSSLYATPLPPAQAELRPPRIELGRFEDLPDRLKPPAQRLREEAEQVLAHRLDLLGSGLVSLGPEIDWHRDFKSGYRWPQTSHDQIEVTCLDDRSDAKVPWELSRCHHLLTLARAARLFEHEPYAVELEAQLGSWLDANPPGTGINWVNPMEIGIRAVNLVWAVGTLERWRPLDRSLRERLTTSLRWHGRHIRANLEGAPYLRSNHYLADLLGLLVLGSVLAGEPDAASWSRFARRELQREIARQVRTDGVSFEASLSYHGLALEMLVIASLVADWAGAPLSEAFHQRLRRMADVSRSTRHGNGRIPLFGDQDSGRILPEGFSRPPTHDNLLWLAAALEHRTRPLEDIAHPEVAWTFGLERWQKATGLPLRAPIPSPAFPEGGIFVLSGARAHLVVRCGDVGQNGFGGHAHNDVLSYELSINGIPLIVDSGTYAYTFDVDARNRFRATSSHNTVRVDAEEINPIDPARVFELRRFARTTVEAYEVSGRRLGLAGSHDGYRRLQDPCVHRRRFAMDAESGEVEVRDEIEGAGSHHVESFLHLAPGARVRRTGEAAFEVELGPTRASVTFEGGGASIETGWVSDRYGVREKGQVLVSRIERALPLAFGYTIRPL
jgi:hypothetical protein